MQKFKSTITQDTNNMTINIVEDFEKFQQEKQQVATQQAPIDDGIDHAADFEKFQQYKQAVEIESKKTTVDRIVEGGRNFAQGVNNFAFGIAHGTNKALIGTVQAGIKLGETAGLLDKDTSKDFNNSGLVNLARVGDAHIKDSTAGKVGEFVGNTAPYLMAPGASTAARIGGGALIGGTQYSEEDLSLGDRAKGAAIGAGTVGALEGAYKIAKPIVQGLTGKTGAVARLKENVPKMTKASTNSTKAADRLGVPITPAEAGGKNAANYKALVDESKLVATEKGQQKVAQAVIQREQVLRKTADDLLEKSVPGGLKKAQEVANKLYKVAHAQPLPSDKLKKLVTDKGVISNVLDEIDKSGALKKSAAKAFKNGTVGQWHGIRYYLDDAIEKNYKAGNTTYAKQVLQPVRDTIDDVLKSSSPALKKADQIYSKYVGLKEMKDQLAKIQPQAGSSVANSSQFYKEFLNSPEKAKDFVKLIEKAGGNTQQAKDLIVVLNRLQNSPITKMLQKEVGTKGGSLPTKGLDIWSSITGYGNRIYRGKYDTAYVDLVFSKNPRWEQELSKIAKMKDHRSMADRLGNLMSKVAAATATSATSE